MNAFPCVSDFWQHRCNRLGERLDSGEAIEVHSRTLWQSFKEEKHQIVLSGPEHTNMRVNMFSVVQGPPRKRSFYDWQYLAGALRHAQRLRAAHASLRCALVRSEADKMIGAVGANLQEMMLTQVEQLCIEVVAWWERAEGVYLSPFAQMGYVMRNWLEGVYGGKPSGQHPSLDALMQVDTDTRGLMAETVKSVFSILQDELGLGRRPQTGLVGVGIWAETAAAELRNLGVECSRYDRVPVERGHKILFLLHSENCITAEVARELQCDAVAELLPGQINPDSDRILLEKGTVVFPDVLCTSAQEIVEDWWLGGRRVPGWERALHIKLEEIWREGRRRAEELGICMHDALLKLALERVAKRWGL